MKKISVIGVGNMGGAIAIGLARSGYAVAVTNRSGVMPDYLAGFENITMAESNAEAAKCSDVIIIAVKSSSFKAVVDDIGKSVDFNHSVIVVLCADLRIAQIEEDFADYDKAPMIARLMPNTAVAVGQSMSFICTNAYAAAYSAELCKVFSPLGRVEVIDETKFSAATLLCSCGIAYAYRYIRASVEGAVALGFEPREARNYICQTLRGAADMLEHYDLNPEVAIDIVTTPGGLTIAGLNDMERAGFTPAVLAGLRRRNSQIDFID